MPSVFVAFVSPPHHYIALCCLNSPFLETLKQLHFHAFVDFHVLEALRPLCFQVFSDFLEGESDQSIVVPCSSCVTCVLGRSAQKVHPALWSEDLPTAQETQRNTMV